MIPVTGAWRPGDPPGRRQWAAGSLKLEAGGELPEFSLAYETWGTLNSDASNAILVEHALTGDSHAAGPAEPGHPSAGWWDGLIGPGKALDTSSFFVVVPNVLGGCQGSTGPSSPDPAGRPWGSRFPVVTVRDQVAAEAVLADALGLDRWAAIVGGSAVESYLDHHAGKLARRFDANSYLVLTESMNTHDVGRGRGGVAAALGRVTARAVIGGVDSDRLYPLYQSAEIAAGIPGAP